MATFNLLNACPITLTHGGVSTCKLTTFKNAEGRVDTLTRIDLPDEPAQVLQLKLQKSLMQNSGNYKPHRLNDTLNQILRLNLHYGPISDRWRPYNGFVRVFDKENGILKRLVRVCGVENISFDLFLEFGTKQDRMILDRKKLALRPPSGYPQENYDICFHFNMTKYLIEKWATATFLGILTINVYLNDKAVSLVELDNLKQSIVSVNWKVLEDASLTGDTVIVAEGAKQVWCHKGFLIAQSDVFKAMFESGMNEGTSNKVEIDDMSETGVRALLCYLYCQDIQMASESCSISIELLMASDKYRIESLQEAIQNVIKCKENSWFSAANAIELWSFSKKKIETDSQKSSKVAGSGFKPILEKAAAVLRTKCEEELEQCSEFQEIFNSPKSAKQLCIYFMLNK